MSQVSFCPKCGSKIYEGEVFCSNCGARVIEENNVQTQAKDENQDVQIGTEYVPEQPMYDNGNDSNSIEPLVKPINNANQSKKYTIIGAIAVGVVVLLVIFIISKLFFGKGPEDVAEDYLEATYDCDADDMMDCWNEDIIKARIDMYGYKDEDEFFEEIFEERAQQRKQNYIYAYGNDWDYEYVLGREKEYDEDDIKYIQDRIYERYAIKEDKLKVTDGVTYSYKVTIMDSDGNIGNVEYEDIDVVKINGSWYVFD